MVSLDMNEESEPLDTMRNNSNLSNKYLGLLLSPIRLSKTDLQPLVDKLARHVPTWKSKLLERSGRLVLINSTLTATPAYHMLSLDLPPWFFKCANKLIKGFFWSAAMEARKGQCIVAWDSVCSPKFLGGLGVKNLRLLNLALRIREIAPNFLRLVKPARLKDYVADALVDNAWAQAFRGTPSVQALVEYFSLWDTVLGFTIDEQVKDIVIWRQTPSGSYTAKSAYELFFVGRTVLAGARELWTDGAPLKQNINMWLVLRDRL
ncbi:hypothetical protein QYE76_011576 [Lolium multiflorum]|uniref:Reverse transcriptase zinc-binding domain-containing protein n=1 Tax=Lolium multiflorum TaxID=4521 RepID=A0AAD8X5R8_LOLMU|nr:hypothetical protein QYE76_011576 [Lolium multiflorum]